MSLYNPPLILRKQADVNSKLQIEDSLKGFDFSYFYTGKRLGHSNNIDLEVSTLIIDSEENQFLRSCLYTGQKEKWKEVIKQQLIKQLQDIGVEPGFIKSETRYFDVSKDHYLSIEKYQIRLLDVTAKIIGNENKPL